MKQNVPFSPSNSGRVPQAGRAESVKRPPRTAPDGGGLTRISAMINGSPGVKSLSQLKYALQHPAQKQDQEQEQRRATATEDRMQGNVVVPQAVVQCLMTGKYFAGQYQDAGTAATGTKIANLLTQYESAWGWGYGLGFTGEYDGKKYRQQRLSILAEIERTIHEHFRDSGAVRINDAPESALMLRLLDDIQVEHEKQIGELLYYKDELPVSEQGLSKTAKAEVQKEWQSIMAGTGNLQISERQKDPGTGLERDHLGFRVKALSSLARLLQGEEGRKVIKAANQGGQDTSQHITIGPVSSKPYDVTDKGKKKGTILASGWDSVYQRGSSAKPASSLAEGTFWLLDDDDDPLGTYELAARKHKEKGEPAGVILGKKKYLFNVGTGSLVNYVAEHKASENRVTTTNNREGLSPTSVALGHELGHAVRKRLGADISGNSDFLKLTGVHPELYGLWSVTDEELLNITQVENKLLVEHGLAPRKYHKDYGETVEFLINLRLEKYQRDPGYDPTKFGEMQQAILAKDFEEAGRLLRAEGF
jgi:hypothetical protein